MAAEAYAGARLALPILQEKIERLKQLSIEQGQTLWMLNERGYNKLLSKEGRKEQIFLTLLAAAFMLWMFGSSYDIERRSNMMPLLRCTVKGRKELLHRKMLAALMITCFAVTLMYVTNILYIHRQYGLGGIYAPIQSLEVFHDFPWHLTIWQYFIVVYVSKLVICILMSESIIACSVFMRQGVLIGLGICIMVMPLALSYFSINFAEWLSCFPLLNGNELWVDGKNSSTNMIKLIILFVIIVVVNVKVHKIMEE